MRKEEYSAKARKALQQSVLDLVQKGEGYVCFKHEEIPEGALEAKLL